MGFQSTKRLLDLNEEDVLESSTQQARPRLIEMEPLGFGMQLPPSTAAPPPAVINTDQDHHSQLHDSNRETELTMYFYVHQPEQQQPQPPPPQVTAGDQDSNRETELTMYFYVQESQPLPQIPPPQQLTDNPPVIHPMTQQAAAPRRNRKRPTHAPREGKSPTIQPPFPWATDRRAQVHTLNHLTNNNIQTISGDVECKRCRKQYQIEYNLVEKFNEVSEYVAYNMHDLKDRAPLQWKEPILPTCNFCHQENSMKPVMSNIKKRSVNWLFLLLGQMVGCCTLPQLKYFCKHTGKHRTGAKDRVLYLTYVELCKQVDPDGPFGQ